MDTSGKSSGTLAPLWRNRDFVLLESGCSSRPTVAACAVGGLAPALWGTLSPAMRSAASLAELAT
jgi:hypothetical protein